MMDELESSWHYYASVCGYRATKEEDESSSVVMATKGRDASRHRCEGAHKKSRCENEGVDHYNPG